MTTLPHDSMATPNRSDKTNSSASVYQLINSQRNHLHTLLQDFSRDEPVTASFVVSAAASFQPPIYYGSSGWKTRMYHDKEQLLACDFFTEETIFLKTDYGRLFIEPGTRRVHLAGLTTNPDGSHGWPNQRQACQQKAPSTVLASCQATTKRLNQSLMASSYRKPCRMGTEVLSAAHQPIAWFWGPSYFWYWFVAD